MSIKLQNQIDNSLIFIREIFLSVNNGYVFY